MAKTLIGNIKGKDGRGISKVEKTATTGVVDTYTITYTDGTKSTYELRNSDDIAIQRQIVPSAAIESSTTATQSYTAGDYVVVNGVLRKVKAAIAKGNAISDSNSAAATVTSELATLANSVSKLESVTDWVYLYGSSGENEVKYRRNGDTVELYWNFVQETKARWLAGNIPQPLRPNAGVSGACIRCTSDGIPTNNVATYEVWDNGNIFFTTLNAESAGKLSGYCCWPIG